jgi:hypothetical protein
MDAKIIKKNLPVYELVIKNEDDPFGINFISLVKVPAINIDFVAFSENPVPQKIAFKVQDSEKRNIAGAFIIPDLPIYRKDETGAESYQYMTSQTIELMQQKFAAKNYWHNINQEHSESVNKAYILENWIVEDPVIDKSVKFGFSLPKGTWFGVVHIADESYWKNFIKTGEVEGFSIQGIMGLTRQVGTLEHTVKSNFSSDEENSIDKLAEIIENFK